MECVATYINKAEKDELKELASNAGKSISGYIRDKLFNSEVSDRELIIDEERALSERLCYDTKLLSQKINMSPSTIKRLCKRGKLTYYKVGSDYRFSEKDVNEFMERCKNPAFIDREDDFLTIPEVAEILRVTYDTASKYVRDKKIDSFKVNGRYRIRKDDFEKYLSECRQSEE